MTRGAAEIVGTIAHRDGRLAAEEAHREGIEAEAAGDGLAEPRTRW